MIWGAVLECIARALRVLGFTRKPVKVLFLGLENAGKTTLMFAMKHGPRAAYDIAHDPTFGLSMLPPICSFFFFFFFCGAFRAFFLLPFFLWRFLLCALRNTKKQKNKKNKKETKEKKDKKNRYRGDGRGGAQSARVRSRWETARHLVRLPRFVWVRRFRRRRVGPRSVPRVQSRTRRTASFFFFFLFFFFSFFFSFSFFRFFFFSFFFLFWGPGTLGTLGTLGSIGILSFTFICLLFLLFILLFCAFARPCFRTWTCAACRSSCSGTSATWKRPFPSASSATRWGSRYADRARSTCSCAPHAGGTGTSRACAGSRTSFDFFDFFFLRGNT
jgi:hypothetical protein